MTGRVSAPTPGRGRSLLLVAVLGAVAPAQTPTEPPPAEPSPAAAPVTQTPATPAPAEPRPGATPGDLGAIELAKAMTATMRLSTPGPEHARLSALAGAFDVVMTLTPPGLPPQECKGSARAASVLGGRYLVVNLSVRVESIRLEGLYVFGFDNLHGLYTASWRDSMSTWAIECSGPADPAPGAAIVMHGTMIDAASPTGRPFDLVLDIADGGFAVAVRDSIGDARVEVMRQQFTRRAEPAAEPGAGADADAPADRQPPARDK